MPDSGGDTPGRGKTGESKGGKHRSREKGGLRTDNIPKRSSENARDKQRKSDQRLKMP